MFRSFCVLLVLLLLSNCGSKRESPVIYFSNASPDTIRNIDCDWIGRARLSLPQLSPGDSRSQSFYITRESQFFGLVKVSWVNAAGEHIRKEFYFKPRSLPSIADRRIYSYVQFYFDQNHVDVVSSDSADIDDKTRRMENLMIKYRQEALERGINPDCVPNKLNLYFCPNPVATPSLISSGNN